MNRYLSIEPPAFLRMTAAACADFLPLNWNRNMFPPNKTPHFLFLQCKSLYCFVVQMVMVYRRERGIAILVKPQSGSSAVA
jgi:hypothetical protein